MQAADWQEPLETVRPAEASQDEHDEMEPDDTGEEIEASEEVGPR